MRQTHLLDDGHASGAFTPAALRIGSALATGLCAAVIVTVTGSDNHTVVHNAAGIHLDKLQCVVDRVEVTDLKLLDVFDEGVLHVEAPICRAK